MRRNLNLGGEQSGHMIFRDFTTTGDGIISALQILRIMQATGQPLSELKKCLKKYPQAQRNLRRERKTAARGAAADHQFGPGNRERTDTAKAACCSCVIPGLNQKSGCSSKGASNRRSIARPTGSPMPSRAQSVPDPLARGGLPCFPAPSP